MPLRTRLNGDLVCLLISKIFCSSDPIALAERRFANHKTSIPAALITSSQGIKAEMARMVHQNSPNNLRYDLEHYLLNLACSRILVMLSLDLDVQYHLMVVSLDSSLLQLLYLSVI